MFEFILIILIAGILFNKLTLGSAFVSLLFILIVKLIYDWRILGKVNPEE